VDEQSLFELFSNGTVFEFRYHDKLRKVTIEKLSDAYIIAKNISIDGAKPDKPYATYSFAKITQASKVE
jgi:hypothetical protein